VEHHVGHGSVDRVGRERQARDVGLAKLDVGDPQLAEVVVDDLSIAGARPTATT
jgi:hypothetical protein